MENSLSSTESKPFSAFVTYIQPSFEELENRFPSGVERDYAYNGRRFEPIDRCKSVSEENREVIFDYVHMVDCFASNDDVLAQMYRRGLRPALYEELIGFTKKYPEEQSKYRIVALGSKVRWDDAPGLSDETACLRSYVHNDAIRLAWSAARWRPDEEYRFLAVRE